MECCHARRGKNSPPASRISSLIGHRYCRFFPLPTMINSDQAYIRTQIADAYHVNKGIMYVYMYIYLSILFEHIHVYFYICFYIRVLCSFREASCNHRTLIYGIVNYYITSFGHCQ